MRQDHSRPQHWLDLTIVALWLFCLLFFFLLGMEDSRENWAQRWYQRWFG